MAVISLITAENQKSNAKTVVVANQWLLNKKRFSENPIGVTNRICRDFLPLRILFRTPRPNRKDDPLLSISTTDIEITQFYRDKNHIKNINNGSGSKARTEKLFNSHSKLP
jgi:hypothetical protein